MSRSSWDRAMPPIKEALDRVVPPLLIGLAG